MSKKTKTLMQFLNFALIGGLGTLTNLVLFYILALFNIHYIVNSCVCFAVAVTQNYLLNNFFTFKFGRVSLKTYAAYVISNLLGLIINLATLALFRTFIFYDLGNLWRDLVAQAFGIAFAMIFNFLAAKFVVFKGKKC